MIMAELSMPIWVFPKQRSFENSSIQEDKLTSPETVAYQVALSVLGLIGASGNIFSILALLKCSKLRQKSTTKFVISLAVSDLLFCTLTVPIMVWHASNDVEIDAAFCPLEEIVFYAPITISLTTLMSISINRYVIVCHNMIVFIQIIKLF